MTVEELYQTLENLKQVEKAMMLCDGWALVMQRENLKNYVILKDIIHWKLMKKRRKCIKVSLGIIFFSLCNDYLFLEEEAKRGKTNTFAFNYDTPNNPEPEPQNGIPTVPEKEEEEEIYVPLPILDVPVDISIVSIII